METLRTVRSRVVRPVFLWALTALITESAVEWISRHGLHLSAPVLLLPVVPAVFFIVALVRAIQKMDELQNRICLESTFIAFMLTLTITFVFSGLERAGVYRAPWDSLGTPMMFIWACAYVYSAWRYR